MRIPSQCSRHCFGVWYHLSCHLECEGLSCCLVSVDTLYNWDFTLAASFQSNPLNKQINSPALPGTEWGTSWNPITQQRSLFKTPRHMVRPIRCHRGAHYSSFQNKQRFILNLIQSITVLNSIGACYCVTVIWTDTAPGPALHPTAACSSWDCRHASGDVLGFWSHASYLPVHTALLMRCYILNAVVGLFFLLAFVFVLQAVQFKKGDAGGWHAAFQMILLHLWKEKAAVCHGEIVSAHSSAPESNADLNIKTYLAHTVMLVCL